MVITSHDYIRKTLTCFANPVYFKISTQAKKRPRFFWISAIAPLISVILSTLFVKVTHVNEHGVAIVCFTVSVSKHYVDDVRDLCITIDLFYAGRNY